jgi:transcriptional regulator with XRE-family HTH domain
MGKTVAKLAKLPNRVDKQVGDRLRFGRCTVGVSSEKLANGVGVTVAQVQRWEIGTDRIGAIHLQKIIKLLGVSAAFFLANKPPNELTVASGTRGLDLSLESRLFCAFANIEHSVSREAVVGLAEKMAEQKLSNR